MHFDVRAVRLPSKLIFRLSFHPGPKERERVPGDSQGALEGGRGGQQDLTVRYSNPNISSGTYVPVC